MLTAFLQVLTVTTKGDVLEKEAEIRLGHAQRVPLFPMLFVLYMNDLHSFCNRGKEKEIIMDNIRELKITITAEDIAIHT